MKQEELEGLRAQYKAKIDAARTEAAKWEGKAIPPEAAATIDGLLGAADELKVKIVTGEKLLDGEKFLEGSSGLTAAHLGWRKSGPTEGLADVDVKSWRELKMSTVETDPVFRVPVPVERVIRYYVPEAVQKKGYTSAFESYARHGKENIGPNDLKTLLEGLDSAGGFLAPEEYHVEMVKKMSAIATIRANARVVSTSRDVAKWPKIHYTTDDIYTSGVRFTWTGEVPASASVHRVTDPVFGMYSVPVHTAMASMPLSNDLLEDSAFDIAGISSDLLAEAFALGENDAFINGTGVGQPMGILAQVDGDGPASVDSGSGTALTADGLIELAYALPAQYERNAKFYMAKKTEKEVRKLRADGTSGDFLWPIVPTVGNLGMVSSELLGFPVVREEFVPEIAGDAYPIIFGDLSGYLIVDRVGFTIQRISETYAEQNITVLLARKRTGGQTIEPWRLRVQKIST